MALLTLFEVATLEMWLDVMHAATDITALGHAPERGANDGAAWFFLVYIFFVAFFVMEPVEFLQSPCSD